MMTSDGGHKWKFTARGRYLIIRIKTGPFMSWIFTIESGLTRWL